MNLTTLEQSKKLKEWGAPQESEFYWAKQYNEGDFVLVSTDEMDWAESEASILYTTYYAALSLEEIIRWLGNDFYSLTGPFENEGPEKWIALSCLYTKVGDEEGDYYEGKGYTPLEAVYNLTQELHGEGE